MNSAHPLQQCYKTLEDPLDHLPHAAIQQFRKRQVIYNPVLPAAGIYLVISGSVKVCKMPERGPQVVIDIYGREEFFGESALIGASAVVHTATALTDATVMMWTVNEIEEISICRPKLAIALLRFIVQRSMHLGNRIESFALDNIPRRLARALIELSARFGESVEDGSVQVMPFSHEFLSQYIGTSREIVTAQMNAFRRGGYLRYSREGIWLHREAISGWLKTEGGMRVVAA